jgi:DNA invertase Pin-like site-specific DNA recombinase
MHPMLVASLAHLVEITAELRRKGVALKIVDMGVDTGTPTGRLFLNIVGSIAEFERAIMLETPAGGDRRGKGRGQVQGPGADRAGQGGRDPQAGG